MVFNLFVTFLILFSFGGLESAVVRSPLPRDCHLDPGLGSHLRPWFFPFLLARPLPGPQNALAPTPLSQSFFLSLKPLVLFFVPVFVGFGLSCVFDSAKLEGLSFPRGFSGHYAFNSGTMVKFGRYSGVLGQLGCFLPMYLRDCVFQHSLSGYAAPARKRGLGFAFFLDP